MRKVYITAALLSLLGLADALYLTVEHLTGETVRCTILSGCSEVLSSRYAVVGGFPLAGIGAAAGYASYGPVKEAVRAITRIAAKEWGKFGINVNAICPFAKSDQFDEWAAANPEQVAMAMAGASLGRVGDCELDIGRAAVFLASDDASYITGHSLMVDGGQSMPL